MFKGLSSVTYRVVDIENAKKWYSMVFDIKPVFDTSFAVAFQVGDSILVIFPAIDLIHTDHS